MDTHLVESYFGWLKADCFTRVGEQRQYEGVLRLLHDIPFYWTIWSDENRAGDARSFRQYEFLEEFPGTEDMDQVLLGQWATAAPSVLEVMLGIARRWSYFFDGPNVAFYFGHMFTNMGFNQVTGRTLGPEAQQAVRNVVDVWLSRQFYPNGIGSPFPLNDGFNPTPDMRRVEIWGQMNAYSAEHFQ